MKVLFITDVHWSQYSSIVRSRGERYSRRLENLIRSMNWAEVLAWDYGCQCIICGGDFFDSSQLNSEEISALQEISWSSISHIFLTGNHETNVSSLEYSTSDVFKLLPNSVVINRPEHYHIEGTDTEFCFLPYILERDRKPLSEYFPPKTEKRIIFSHNDLKDVQYGAFLSTEGFGLQEIEDNCDLFMNGHIHNCSYVTSKIINGGNLTGQNFTEDGYKYKHFVQIIDTDTLEVQFFENPYAMYFYKIDLTTKQPHEFKDTLAQLARSAVVTIRVSSKDLQDLKQLLPQCSNIVEHRIIVEPEVSTPNEVYTPVVEAVDHLKQFESYVLENIGDTNIIREELNSVMR